MNESENENNSLTIEIVVAVHQSNQNQIMDDNKNLDFLCRVCLIKDDSSIMISLHDPKIRQMFYECTSIAVSFP